MEIIVTLPPPYLRRMKEAISSPGIDAFRLNTGVVTPYNAYDTIKKILNFIDEDQLWIDIKGRQIRIDLWAVPEYSELILNREIEVDLPAVIYFRHEKIASEIVEMKGRKIYVDPLPANFVGAGQAVNIHGLNFNVKGNYLMRSDIEYIEAAKQLGVNKFMLSFLEKQSDIDEVLALNKDAKICGKIETPLGLEFIENNDENNNVDRLMLARDDLFINLRFNADSIFEASKHIIQKDRTAIAASRILNSLLTGDVALSDLSDIYLLKSMGYDSFLLGDELSKDVGILRHALEILNFSTNF